jgi:hypothetical protein
VGLAVFPAYGLPQKHARIIAHPELVAQWGRSSPIHLGLSSALPPPTTVTGHRLPRKAEKPPEYRSFRFMPPRWVELCQQSAKSLFSPTFTRTNSRQHRQIHTSFHPANLTSPNLHRRFRTDALLHSTGFARVSISSSFPNTCRV